jgi:hypothetical protein
VAVFLLIVILSLVAGTATLASIVFMPERYADKGVRWLIATVTGCILVFVGVMGLLLVILPPTD